MPNPMTTECNAGRSGLRPGASNCVRFATKGSTSASRRRARWSAWHVYSGSWLRLPGFNRGRRGKARRVALRVVLLERPVMDGVGFELDGDVLIASANFL